LGRNGKKSAAVFIDRDGTLIHEKHYLRKIKDVKLFSGSVEAIKILKGAGFKIIVVTNQSGIGRGYLTEEKLNKINRHIERVLAAKGAKVATTYYCPHVPEDRCSCRKPGLGMVKRAEKRFNVDLKRSYAVGDHVNDFLLGKNMGGTGVFLLTGHGKEEHEKIKSGKTGLRPDRVEKNLLTAARWIIKNNEKSKVKNQKC
jgi:histidinol-phosphate phosphatase family protein